MATLRFPDYFPPILSETVGCEDLLEEDRLDVLGGRKNTRGKTFVVGGHYPKLFGLEKVWKTYWASGVQ